MKTIKVLLGALSIGLAAASTPALAARYGNNTPVDLTYTFTTSGGAASIVQYPSPAFAISPYLDINLNPGALRVNTSFNSAYHIVEFGSGGSFATVHYGGINQYLGSIGAYALSYDAGTRHLTGGSTLGGSTFYQGTYCASSTPMNCVELGGEFYSSAIRVPISTALDLYFDPTFSNVTGTVTFNTNFANGDVLSRIYEVDMQVISSVPVPGSALMFGSALLAMAGARRRKR